MAILVSGARSRAALFACASTCAVLAATNAQAIFINERAAAELGFENIWDSDDRFPAVVAISLDGNKYCTGTLIDSRTILTASHCLADAQTEIFDHVPQLEIRFGTDASIPSPDNVGLAGARIHPDYDTNVFAQNDIAVLTLAEPVTSVEPVKLLPQGEQTAAFGQIMHIVGYGAAGIAGVEMDIDYRRRLAQMQFGGLERLYGNEGHEVIFTQFRDPENPGNEDALSLDEEGFPVPFLQGSAAPGDSGGPIFVERDGEMIQVGTVIGGFYPDGVGDPRVPDHPILNVYMPLELFGDWVLANAAYRLTTAAAGDWNWSDAAAWTDTLGRHEVPDNRDGSFDGRGEMGRYYGVRLASPGLMTLDMDAEIDDLRLSDHAARLDIPGAFGLDVLTWTALDKGRLTVNGRLTTGILAIDEGWLHGSGVVEAAMGVVNERGVVMPGTRDRVAALTIDGDYWHGPEAMLVTTIGEDETATLRVTGRAVVHGGLRVEPRETLITPGVEYTVLEAADGLEGAFADAETSLAFLDPVVRYSPTAANASFERNAVAFASFTRTDNARSAADALETVDPASTLYRHVVNLTGPGTVEATFSRLSAEAYGTVGTALTSQSRMLRNVLISRLRRHGDPAATSTPWLGYGPTTGFADSQPAGVAGTTIGTWALAHTADGDIDGDGNAAGVDHDTSGVFGGVTAESADWKIGGMFGYTDSAFAMPGQAAGGDAESFHLGAHGTVAIAGVDLSGGLLHSWHGIETTRALALPGFSANAEADYDARTLQAFGEAAYRFEFGAAALTSFVGLSVVNHRTDGFTDTGGIAALSVARASHTQIFSTLGLRTDATVYRGETVALSVRAGAGWNHAFRDLAPVVTAAFATGAPFRSAGVGIDRDTLVLNAGLGARLNDRFQIDVDYAGEVGDRTRDHTLMGRVTVDF